MKENNSRLFVAATIIIVLLLAAFMALSGRIFDWLSSKSASSAGTAETAAANPADSGDYFNTSILGDKRFDGLKDSSSGFDFDTVGKKTMPPAQNIFDAQGNLIGKQTPVKTYVGNNRPF